MAALVLLGGTTTSYAHQGDPTIVARIDAVQPPLPGVTVEVRAGVADQLFVANTTGTEVEVLGTGGQPFLRIAKEAVRANVRSKDWLASLSPFGTNRAGQAGTEWRVVAAHGSWGWFDHRMHDRDRPLTPALRKATTPVTLASWTVPLRHGGATHDVHGHVEYRPVTGAFRSRATSVPDGASVDVLDGRVPGLFVRWTGRGTLTVRGIEGEPFARLSPKGTEVNDASATWHDDRGLRGNASPPAVDPNGTPRWRRVADAPAFTWLDRRLAYAPGVPSDDALRRKDPTTMVEWEIPADVDGRPTRITGETVWHPRDSGGRGTSERLAGIAAAVAVSGVIGGMVALRRRARGSRP